MVTGELSGHGRQRLPGEMAPWSRRNLGSRMAVLVRRVRTFLSHLLVCFTEVLSPLKTRFI